MGGLDFGQGVQPEGRVDEAQQQAASGQPPPPDASPPDVSEPTFDGQGNIQTPGSDPYPISELTGSDKETVNALGEQYQQEGGSNPSELLSGYDGPLTEDGIAQYLSDKVQYDDAFISDNDYYNATDFASWVGEKASASSPAVDEERDNQVIEGVGDHLMDQGVSNDPHDIQGVLDEYAESQGFLPGSEKYNKLQDAGHQFMVDRAEGAAEQMTDYQMMEKMMQKYNVDNKRRDPILLSNRGGRQR